MQDEKKWNEMDAASGGKLNEQCAELIASIPELTLAEARVWTLVTRHYSNDAIADILGLAAGTVDNYSSNVRHRLGIPRWKGRIKRNHPPPMILTESDFVF